MKTLHLQKPLRNLWLIVVVAATLLIMTLYGVAQHIIRVSANFTPAELAISASNQMDAGTPIQNIVDASKPIDLAVSQSSFVQIYSPDAKPVIGTGLLNGQLAVPPAGIFEYVKSHGEERFSWEPSRGLRIAAVMRYAAGSQPGYVLAGVSLAEPEKLESSVAMLCVIGWLVTCVGILLVALGLERLSKKE